MDKACPVILRKTNRKIEVLSFQHPTAGKQIIKGTIENGETLAQACQRELREESGIMAQAQDYLGSMRSAYNSKVWGFYRMAYAGTLPDQWQHYSNDDGGQLLTFFWQPLLAPMDKTWHPVFQETVDFIKTSIPTGA